MRTRPKRRVGKIRHHLVCDRRGLPWNAKAESLLREQYASVGSAALRALPKAVLEAEQAAGRVAEVAEIASRMRSREDDARQYSEAYGRYCWPVSSADDLRLAPFHLLASEGRAHVDRDHVWHLEELARIVGEDDRVLRQTPSRVVDLSDPESEAQATDWWETRTSAGSEGMVVKPLAFVTRGRRGLVQPALKVRGREYLRIIYGPSYTEPENLSRLRSRGVATKRSLALREFALGVEALERFVRKEPLRRVHECVFGVLALESEPVDPRL